MSNPESLQSRLEDYQHRVERVMDKWLPPDSTQPGHLHQAMRYAALSGGKRLRPILTYATGEALGIPPAQLDAIAASLELIHSYSLVHDDLPAMDDDELRRGKPTCHIAFNEATAILAGDALQALAFYILTHDDELRVSADTRLRMIEMLANACGSRGMAGGQAIDLASVGKTLSIAELEEMHIHKTGALIRVSVVLAAICHENISQTQLDQLDHYGKCIGLAFQIRDDILDEEGETSVLGKNRGADRASNKPTYPSIAGIGIAKERAQDLYKEAISSLSEFDARAELLRSIAEFIIKRPR